MRIFLSTMLVIAMQSGAAYLPNNWVASGTTNSSLPGTAFMDSVQVTNSAKLPLIVDSNGSNLVAFAGVSSAVNSIAITNAVTTGRPTIAPVGTDSAIGMDVHLKGTTTGTTMLKVFNDNSDAWYFNRAARTFGYYFSTDSSPRWQIDNLGTLSMGNGSALDLGLVRDAAAVLQLGADAANPIHQTLKAHDATGTDKSGANLILKGGYGTGTGRGGDLITMTSVSSNTTGAVVQYYSTRHYESAKPAPVTNSAACPLFNILVSTNHYLACKIFASTFASDVGGDFQAFAEELNVCAVNKAGTIAPTVSTSWGTNLAASSASTLTTTWTAVTSGNSLDIKITPVSSLTPTTYYTKWKVDVLSNDPATITPQ